MGLTLLVQYSTVIKGTMGRGILNHYSVYACFQISNREQTPRKVKTGRRLQKIFNASIYHYRGLIEGIFGAEETKHHQLYCRFRLKNNQKRFGLIKSVGWNLEVLNRLQCANKLGLKVTQYAISN